MLGVIRNEQGEYLSMVRGQVAFVPEKRRAFVYDSEQDNVHTQIEEVHCRFNVEWTFEAVSPRENPYVEAKLVSMLAAN